MHFVLDIPSLKGITAGVSNIGAAAVGYLGMDVIQILAGIALIYLAIKMAKRAAGKLVYMIAIAAIYLFSRGLLNMGMLLDWWHQLPEFVEKIFVLGRSFWA